MTGRSPRGGRGLKCNYRGKVYTAAEVALLAEGVD